MKLKDFIYEYSTFYFFFLIMETNDYIPSICLDIYYDKKTRLRRDIHDKYFYKYFIFSDKITDVCFRFMDYDPDYINYLYDANDKLKYITYKQIKDDTFINKKLNNLTKCKDDIFYYKYKKYLKHFL